MYRKSLIVLCLTGIIHFSTYAQNSIKVSVDLGGSHKVSIEDESASESVQAGFTGGLEFVKDMSPNVGIGGGIEFQLPRYQTDDPYKSKFNFIPVYAAVRFHGQKAETMPFFDVRLGYNLFNGESDYKGPFDLSGGLYYGIGGGVIYKRAIFEVIYSVNNGSGSYSGVTLDVAYSKISLSLGIIISPEK